MLQLDNPCRDRSAGAVNSRAMYRRDGAVARRNTRGGGGSGRTPLPTHVIDGSSNDVYDASGSLVIP